MGLALARTRALRRRPGSGVARPLLAGELLEAQPGDSDGRHLGRETAEEDRRRLPLNALVGALTDLLSVSV